MTSVTGAAIGGGAGFTTSITVGAGLTSAGGGAPCGACASATIDSPASTTASRILTSNHRFSILSLFKSLQFPVVLDARPCPLGPAVHGSRRELAYASPALAASSSRRWPEERSTLLSSTLPSTSIRKVNVTRPVSLARIEAAG